MANSSETIGQTKTPGKRPHTKILVDGGDPEETIRIKQLIGFVDGQTTNPSLIAKNPEIKHLVESGHQLTERVVIHFCSSSFSRAFLSWLADRAKKDAVLPSY